MRLVCRCVGDCLEVLMRWSGMCWWLSQGVGSLMGYVLVTVSRCWCVDVLCVGDCSRRWCVDALIRYVLVRWWVMCCWLSRGVDALMCNVLVTARGAVGDCLEVLMHRCVEMLCVSDWSRCWCVDGLCVGTLLGYVLVTVSRWCAMCWWRDCSRCWYVDGFCVGDCLEMLVCWWVMCWWLSRGVDALLDCVLVTVSRCWCVDMLCVGDCLEVLVVDASWVGLWW
jgi:hypothetical protein